MNPMEANQGRPSEPLTQEEVTSWLDDVMNGPQVPDLSSDTILAATKGIGEAKYRGMLQLGPMPEISEGDILKLPDGRRFRVETKEKDGTFTAVAVPQGDTVEVLEGYPKDSAPFVGFPTDQNTQSPE